MLGDPPPLARKRSRPVGLLDLPSPLLEDILLRVADSERGVEALPSPDALDEPVPAFLGDVREPSNGQAGERGCTYWLTTLGTMTCPDGVSGYRTLPHTPSGVLTLRSWQKLLPVLTTCRTLYRLGLSAVRGLILGPGASSLTAARSLRVFPLLRLVVVSSTLGCSGSDCFPERLTAASSECRTAKAIRDESLLPEALRRLTLSGLAYRGQLFPSGLLASLHQGASAPFLKRLVLEGLEDDGGGLCLSQSLRVHAPTLVELSLMLPLKATFFRDALRPSTASPQSVLFPALRRLGLLVTNPPDVAVIVRAAPALTGIRLATSVTWKSKSGLDWKVSDSSRPAALLLGSSLATTAGRLTSFELTGQDFSSPGFSAPSVVDFLITHAATLRSLRVSSTWGRQWETTTFPPSSFGQLSHLVLGLADFAGDDLGPLLDRLCSFPVLFPALVELRLAVEVRPLPSGESRPVRCLLNLAHPDYCGAWPLGPSGLRRAHLRGPLPMLQAVTQAVTSPSLLALAVEGDCYPLKSASLSTQVVAGLASRCPALRAVRLDRLTFSGRLVELLDLQGIRGLFGKCALWPRWPRLEGQMILHEFYDCHSLNVEWRLPHV